MKYRVIIQPEAIEDIGTAYSWIAENAPEGAKRWADDLDDAMHSLEDFPRRCPIAPESKFFRLEIRQMLFGKHSGIYRVLFTVHKDEVHVLYVRHCARRHLE